MQTRDLIKYVSVKMSVRINGNITPELIEQCKIANVPFRQCDGFCLVPREVARHVLGDTVVLRTTGTSYSVRNAPNIAFTDQQVYVDAKNTLEHTRSVTLILPMDMPKMDLMLALRSPRDDRIVILTYGTVAADAWEAHIARVMPGARISRLGRLRSIDQTADVFIVCSRTMSRLGAVGDIGTLILDSIPRTVTQGAMSNLMNVQPDYVISCDHVPDAVPKQLTWFIGGTQITKRIYSKYFNVPRDKDPVVYCADIIEDRIAYGVPMTCVVKGLGTETMAVSCLLCQRGIRTDFAKTHTDTQVIVTDDDKGLKLYGIILVFEC